jgi:hypothetical protein
VTFLATRYRGHDLLTEMPNGREYRDESWTVASDAVDGAIGQVAYARVWSAPTTTRPHLFTLTTRTEITDFLHWFAERRGAYKEFWVPTWRRDFQLVSGALAAATTLTVYDTDYTTLGFPLESRKHLAVIVAANGARTVYPRRITASVDNGDGTETLTLESAVGVDLDTHVVLSHLLLCRLADDRADIEWMHKGAAETRLRFVEIPRQVEG